MSNNNIYNYKTPKSGNEETRFFNLKGRITRKSFFLRFLFSIGLCAAFTFLKINGFFCEYGSRSFIFFETIYLYVLPSFVLVFNLIQGAKRMHDVNKSGWYFFIPIYNIYLTFSPGTKNNNDYGIDPAPLKHIQYFDEKESNKQDNKKEESITENKSGLDKWRDHLSQVRKQNPNKTYQESLEIAQNTYKYKKSAINKTTETTKKKSKNYLLLLTIVVAAAIYYFKEHPGLIPDFGAIRDRFKVQEEGTNVKFDTVATGVEEERDIEEENKKHEMRFRNGSKVYVKVERAYFYDKPNSLNIRSSYLVMGDKAKINKMKYGFAYIKFYNQNSGKFTNGWIKLIDFEIEEGVKSKK